MGEVLLCWVCPRNPSVELSGLVLRRLFFDIGLTNGLLSIELSMLIPKKLNARSTDSRLIPRSVIWLSIAETNCRPQRPAASNNSILGMQIPWWSCSCIPFHFFSMISLFPVVYRSPYSSMLCSSVATMRMTSPISFWGSGVWIISVITGKSSDFTILILFLHFAMLIGESFSLSMKSLMSSLTLCLIMVFTVHSLIRTLLTPAPRWSVSMIGLSVPASNSSGISLLTTFG